MQPERATTLRGRAGLALFIVAAAAVWWGLDRAEPRPAWLRVEAPRRAIVGQPFRIRVQLAPLAEPGVLYADLHWGPSRDQPMQYLGTDGPKAVGKEGGTFDFEIMVARRVGLRFVMGVIYLSRTGGWGGHKLAASTKLIPAVSDTAAPPEIRLEPLGLQPLADLRPGHPRPAALPRLLTGLFFLAAMMTAWSAGHPASSAHGGAGQDARWWQVLVVLLALACLAEVLGLESWVGTQARAMARAKDSYYLRVVFQKVVISTAVAATVLLLLLLRCARRSRRLLLISLTLYLAVSAVNLMSLHAIDKVADLSWHGLSLVQALKLACAAMTWQGVRKVRDHAPTGA